MPYVRAVKTASGATAVQIVYSSHRGSREIEHIGSAHDDAELELLKAVARQRLAAGQGEFDLGLDTAAAGGPLPITASRMGCLADALEHAYRVLGFDQASGGDEVFAQLVLARIIEPVSKADSLRAGRPVVCDAQAPPSRLCQGGYVAVFNEDVVRHYQAFLDRRRQARPADEYRKVTQPEWLGFEEHFDQRKVELGGCARPYGTPCQHEHACLRCPMININPKMLPRLDEIEDDLQARRSRAGHEGWLGEIEGIDLTLTFLRQKRDQTRRLARIAPTDLGMPGVLATGSP